MSIGAKNEYPIVLYDCFSNQQFGGNIGAIVLNASDLETDQMQKIAREINASVSGFVTGQDGSEVSIKFFMPGAEIAMCGHVTIGLFTDIFANSTGSSDYVMKAKAGDVDVRVTAQEGDLPTVMMQLSPPKTASCDVDMNALASALGVSASLLAARAPVGFADAGLQHIFVHFDKLQDVEALAPDFQKLTEVSKACGVLTVGCFSMETSDPANTVHLRDFCPAVGVNEVPASGTTNGALMGYMLQHGFIDPQSQTVLAEQGSEIGRPSLINSEIVVADGKITDLWVGGQAVASIKGVLTI